MYRTDPIMARGEGDILRSHFVERVVKLPMVQVAWDFAANTYSQIKESNKLVYFTLSSAEKSAVFVVGQAKPVVQKFEKQIQAVDSLACIGLGTLEERVPFIKKDAHEIMSETRKLYADTVYSRLEGFKKVGTHTARSAADFGLQKVTSIFGERLVQSVLSTVTKDEKPPRKDEEAEPLKQKLTKSIQQHTYKLLKIEYIQEKTIDFFIIYPITAMEITKSNLEQYLNKLWFLLLQEGSDEAQRSLIVQQLLHLARLVSRQVASFLVPPLKFSNSNGPNSREKVTNGQTNDHSIPEEDEE